MNARDELYAVLRLAGEDRAEAERLTARHRAEVLREAAEHLAQLRDTTDTNAADGNRYDFRQRVALRVAEDRIRRMASKAEAGTPAP